MHVEHVRRPYSARVSDLAEPLPGIEPERGANRFTGYLLYFVAAVLFAVNGTVSKSIILTGIEVARLSQLRVTAAFLLLFVVVAATRPQTLRIKRTEIVPLLAYGVLGVAMTQFLYFIALNTLPVGIALLIEFTSPFIVALWFRFGLGHATRMMVWVALVIALVGLAMIGQVWDGFTLDGVGVAAAFGAAFALALYYVLGDRQVRPPFSRDAVSLTMWGFGMAALFWAIVKPVWSFPWGELAGVGYPLGEGSTGVPVWMLAAWMVVLGTIVPFWLVVAALNHIRATQASVIGLMEPLLATAVAWIALGEVLAPAQLIGGAIVLIGVFLAEHSR